MIALAVAAAAALTAAGDLPVQVVFKGNPKASASEKGCVSWWGPSIVVTNSNTTIMCAACKPNARGAPVTSWTARSTSAGRTWGAPERTPPGTGCGETVYSRTSNTIFQPVPFAGAKTGGGGGGGGDHEGVAVAAAVGQDGEEAADGKFELGSNASCSPCCTALRKFCLPFAGKGAACLKCEQAHAAELNSSSACGGDPSGKVQREWRLWHVLDRARCCACLLCALLHAADERSTEPGSQASAAPSRRHLGRTPARTRPRARRWTSTRRSGRTSCRHLPRRSSPSARRA